MKKQKKHLIRSPLFRPVFLLLLLVLSGCEEKASKETKQPVREPKAAGSVEMRLQEAKLATVAGGYDKATNVFFSTNGSVAGFVAWKDGAQFVVVGESRGRSYEAVWRDTIAVSRDGRRIAYSGKREGKWHVILDGREGKPYENTGSLIFSPDGRLMSCEVKDAKGWFIQVYDGDNEVYRSKSYRDSFRPPVFSEDGRLLVFELGDRGKKKREVFFLDVPGRKILKKREYADLGVAGKFSFSSDFSRVIYEAGKEGRFVLVLQDLILNQEKTISPPDLMLGTVVLSPNGETFAYIADRAGQQYLETRHWTDPKQGNEQGPYEAVNPPVFSPDSMTLAFTAVSGGRWRTVIGGREGEAVYDGIDTPIFSFDGSRIAYPAMRKGKFIIVIASVEKPDAVKEGPAFDMAISPAFSPDSRRIAYRARTGPLEKAKRFIVVADAESGKVIKQGPIGDEIWPPVFSPDGKAVGYGARIGNDLWWKVQRLL